jgi:AcrR family transcriptional regulator
VTPLRADTLPRGRHSIPRNEVKRIQRERILVAAIEKVASKGYVGTTVENITRAARVSRRTF